MSNDENDSKPSASHDNLSSFELNSSYRSSFEIGRENESKNDETFEDLSYDENRDDKLIENAVENSVEYAVESAVENEDYSMNEFENYDEMKEEDDDQPLQKSLTVEKYEVSMYSDEKTGDTNYSDASNDVNNFSEEKAETMVALNDNRLADRDRVRERGVDADRDDVKDDERYTDRYIDKYIDSEKDAHNTINDYELTSVNPAVTSNQDIEDVDHDDNDDYQAIHHDDDRHLQFIDSDYIDREIERYDVANNTIESKDMNEDLSELKLSSDYRQSVKISNRYNDSVIEGHIDGDVDYGGDDGVNDGEDDCDIHGDIDDNTVDNDDKVGMNIGNQDQRELLGKEEYIDNHINPMINPHIDSHIESYIDIDNDKSNHVDDEIYVDTNYPTFLRRPASPDIITFKKASVPTINQLSMPSQENDSFIQHQLNPQKEIYPMKLVIKSRDESSERSQVNRINDKKEVDRHTKSAPSKIPMKLFGKATEIKIKERLKSMNAKPISRVNKST